MYNHAPLTDLNPFAMEIFVLALGERIKEQKAGLLRLQRKQKRGVLWGEKRWRNGQKPLEIPHRFLVWPEPGRSPYDIIADAQERINEIEAYQRSFNEDIPIE